MLYVYYYSSLVLHSSLYGGSGDCNENYLEGKHNYQSGFKKLPSFCYDNKEYLLYFSFFVKAVSSEASLPATKEHLSPQLYFYSPSVGEKDLKLKRATRLIRNRIMRMAGVICTSRVVPQITPSSVSKECWNISQYRLCGSSCGGFQELEKTPEKTEKHFYLLVSAHIKAVLKLHNIYSVYGTPAPFFPKSGSYFCHVTTISTSHHYAFFS